MLVEYTFYIYEMHLMDNKNITCQELKQQTNRMDIYMYLHIG